MIKKITIILEGNITSVNELLLNYFEKIQLPTRLKYTFSCVEGIENLKNKSAYPILLLSTIEENKLLQKIQLIKGKHKNIKILLHTNFIEADFICALFNKGIDAHVSMQDSLSEFVNAIGSIVANKKFHSHHSDKIISDYYSKSQIKKSPSEKPLTKKEKLVLKYLCKGKSSPEIAEILFKM